MSSERQRGDDPGRDHGEPAQRRGEREQPVAKERPRREVAGKQHHADEHDRSGKAAYAVRAHRWTREGQQRRRVDQQHGSRDVETRRSGRGVRARGGERDAGGTGEAGRDTEDAIIGLAHGWSPWSTLKACGVSRRI